MDDRFVYIAGPIAGKDDGNKHNFKNAAHHLQQKGWTPINPHDIEVATHEGSCPPGPAAGSDANHNAPCFMKGDIKALLECEAVYMLEGWEYSSGARTEFEVARACGLTLMYQHQGD